MDFSIFNSIGFNFKSDADTLDAINYVEEKVISLDDMGTGYIILRIHYVDIRFEYENNKVIRYSIFTPTEEIIDFNDFKGDYDKRGLFYYRGSDNNGYCYEAYPFFLDFVDYDHSQNSLKLQTLYMPKNVHYWHNTSEFFEEADGEYADVYIDSNFYNELFSDNPNASVYMNTTISEVKEFINPCTNKKFYILKLESMDRLMTTIVSEYDINTIPRVGEYLSGEFYLFGNLFSKFYGYRGFKGYKIASPKYPNIHNILELYEALYQSYSIDTTYPGCRDSYTISNKTLGQCCITSILVHELTGADIMLYDDGEYEHYYNRLNGAYLDLCSESANIYHNTWDYDKGRVIPLASFKSENLFSRLKLLKDGVRKYKRAKGLKTSYYDALGYSMNDYSDDLMAIHEDNYDYAYEIECKDINIEVRYLNILNKPEMYYYIKNNEAIDFMPFYNSNNFIELNNAHAYKRNGIEDKSFIIGEANDGSQLRFFNITYPKINKLRSKNKYKLEVSLLADTVSLYKDSDEFNKIYPNMTAHQYKSYLELSKERNYDVESRYYLGGYIKDIKKSLNIYTNSYIYEIAINHKGHDIVVLVGQQQLKKEPEIGNILIGEYYASAKVMRLFEGYLDFKDRIIEKSTNPHLRTVLDLYRALYESYTIESSYPRSKPYWSKGNRTIGQCAIVAMLVYDLLGGEIRIINGDRGQHYYNVIDGKILDLTTEQYDISFDDINYKAGRVVKRESFKSDNCLKRYDILINNLKNYLKGLE